jgi:hypothetical protein
MSVAIRWPDGEMERAPTWGALLDMLRQQQFEDLTEARFRIELGRRAYNWSYTQINAWAPPRRLFQELARAGMLDIIEDDEEVKCDGGATASDGTFSGRSDVC